MASTKFYLDMRRAKRGGAYPLKLTISHNNKTASISLDVDLLPSQWNETLQKVVNCPNKTALNFHITSQKQAVDERLRELLRENKLQVVRSSKDLKGFFVAKKTNTKSFVFNYLKMLEIKKPQTKKLYLVTLKHIEKWIGDTLENLNFDDINKEWVLKFCKYLESVGICENTIVSHISHIRAVFNYAIDNNITSNYPFRKLSIKRRETLKRSLSVEDLRRLFSAELKPKQAYYRDIFKLIFFLVGINIADLCYLKEITREGRVEYYRKKTGKLYSIKIEKETREIIERYKGKDYLLNIAEGCCNYACFTTLLNNNLSRIAKKLELSSNNLTTYWARHSWATIAFDLDIPMDIISRSLGHSFSTGASITQVYVNFNRDKIDLANRKVIDYVLYGKK